ncbi:hypothetical protein DKM44_02025 [Deinococcus irradiatisoli]|uniref:N-acetyltransferase domain-containing protein n=1 Tax=Deinococcus irradiatisoli TaxID=2202254 RepID=A0A2Z3JAM7_9DEIO|nr:GNAT family N-acetyltransferase [Deinococcus irradiatisoli]AWN22163.1 hypothetical protein DKM44_02025 [Deinococcus irradiatisoli]
MTFTVRPFEPGDAAAAAQVYTLARPGNPATAEGLLHSDQMQRQAQAHAARWVACQGQQTLGVAEVLQPLGSAAAGAFWLELAVREEARGQGMGGALYRAAHADLQAWARTSPVTSVRVVLSETNPIALRFAFQRGYAEDVRYWDRALILEGWNGQRFGREVAGVAFSDLPSFQAAFPDWEAALHAAYQDARADLPRPAGEAYRPITREVFREWVLGDPDFLPQGLHLAHRGGDVLAYTSLQRAATPGDLIVGMTGTRRAERGQGLATALKVRSLLWAQADGHRRVLTTNDSRNLPMLAVNDRLGFGRQPARIGLVRAWPATSPSVAPL